MLRSAWLGNAELSLHRLTESAGRLFAIREEFGNSAPDWIRQRLERAHGVLD
jgi:hypothetical protein